MTVHLHRLLTGMHRRLTNVGKDLNIDWALVDNRNFSSSVRVALI